MKNSIRNTNSKGEKHGYQEWYSSDNKLTLRGNWKNNKEIGCEEWHRYKVTNFYIK